MRTIIVLAMLLVTAGSSNAAEIKALITTAMQAAIVELVPPFERASRPQGDGELRSVRRPRPPARAMANSPT